MRARKRFGQHFLEPPWVDRVVAAIAPAADDTILEIGPGQGVLTLALAARAARVIALEIDRDLVPALRGRVPGNVTVVLADALTADLASFAEPFAPTRVAGNLPYNVSTPILARLLETADSGRLLRDATVMLQREVADRLAAVPGTRDWGVLSACQQMRADVTPLLALPPGAFRPVPQVHSAVVRLAYRPPKVPLASVALYEAMVRSLFTQRRKMLTNAVAMFAASRGLTGAGAVARAGLDGRRRPETLDLSELARLCAVFASA